MDTRKQTPDILGDLLSGTPAHQHTSVPAHHNAGTGTDEKQAGSEFSYTEKSSTGTKKASSRSRAAGTTSSSAKKGTERRSTAPKQAEAPSGIKVTFYVSEAAAEALEKAWQALRSSAPASRRSRISKSAIVQQALLDHVQELEEKGGRSRLARAFSE